MRISWLLQITRDYDSTSQLNFCVISCSCSPKIIQDNGLGGLKTRRSQVRVLPPEVTTATSMENGRTPICPDPIPGVPEPQSRKLCGCIDSGDGRDIRKEYRLGSGFLPSVRLFFSRQGDPESARRRKELRYTGVGAARRSPPSPPFPQSCQGT